jgi:hypothetical protein
MPPEPPNIFAKIYPASSSALPNLLANALGKRLVAVPDPISALETVAFAERGCPYAPRLPFTSQIHLHGSIQVNPLGARFNPPSNSIGSGWVKRPISGS